MRPVLLAHQDGDGSADPYAVLTGRRFLLLGDDDGAAAAHEVAARLASYGAEAVPRTADHLLTEADGPVDGVLWLDPLAAARPPVLPGAFPVVRAALERGPRWLLAVRPAGARHPAPALGGTARHVPDGRPRVPADGRQDRRPRRHRSGRRRRRAGRRTDRPRLRVRAGGAAYGGRPPRLRHGRGAARAPSAASGAGPAGDGAAEAAAARPGPGLGGAAGRRGPGHHREVRRALASASRCRIELVGRTPAPTGPEDPVTAAARHGGRLRAALAAPGGRTPAEIEPRRRTPAGPAGDHRHPGGAAPHSAARSATTPSTSATPTPRSRR